MQSHKEIGKMILMILIGLSKADGLSDSLPGQSQDDENCALHKTTHKWVTFSCCFKALRAACSTKRVKTRLETAD